MSVQHVDEDELEAVGLSRGIATKLTEKKFKFQKNSGHGHHAARSHMAKSEAWKALRAALCVACLALCLVAVADYRGVEGPVALASGWVLPAPRMQSSFPVLAR